MSALTNALGPTSLVVVATPGEQEGIDLRVAIDGKPIFKARLDLLGNLMLSELCMKLDIVIDERIPGPMERWWAERHGADLRKVGEILTP